MPQKVVDRTGEMKKMKCGLDATIIACRKRSDIDVQFSDGAISCNKQYTSFLKGEIRHPAIKAVRCDVMDRTGETRRMTNELEATIIRYRNSRDIDVRFSNGEIACNKQYKSFLRGNIKCPEVRLIKDRTGETGIMGNGIEATVIAYRDFHDIDVRFSNGAIAYHCDYGNFTKGEIKCPMLFEYIDDYVKVTNPNVNPAFSFLIDAEDVPLVSKYWWSKHERGYVQGIIDGNQILLHRLVMQAPDDVSVDHKNGDTLNCRKANLRFCSAAENGRNRGANSNNTSGFKGVSWSKREKKWVVHICADRKVIHIGYFIDKIEAALAYNEAAIKYHGEFARLNDISA